MRKIMFYVCCVLGFVAIVTLLPPDMSAQQKPIGTWAMKDCYTLDDVTAFLNTLPTDRAVDAKVLAINSQRSFLGSMSTPYYVWYRR